jgi:hypothetical protein
MKYNHPQIQVEKVAPGHYSVTGIPAQTFFKEGEGHTVAPNTLYISPAVPDELLEAILADRATQRKLGKTPEGSLVDPKEPVSFSQDQPVNVDIRDGTARETKVETLGKKEKRKYTPRAKKGTH